MLNGKVLKRLIFLLASLYIILCAINFASGRVLWLDENSILENLRTLSPAQLFGPLKHNQGFPRLYLCLIQNLSIPSGFNVYSLRLLPFVFMLSAFFAWLRIYKEEEGVGAGYVLFILSWCGSHFMTYYSAELKQYSSDVLTAALFTLFILNQKNYLNGRTKELALTVKCALLPSLVLFSYTSYFFVLIPLYNFLLGARDDKRNKFYMWVYLASLVFFAGVSYNFDLKYTLADAGLRSYWNDYFISVSSFSEFLQSFTEGFRNLFARWFLEAKLIRRIMTVFLPFSVYALGFYGWRQIKEDKGAILSLKTLTPVLIGGLALAGILKVYPFTGARITIFIAPFIFYAIIKGIELFKNKIPWVYITLFSVYTVTLMYTSLHLFRQYMSKL